MGKRHSFMDREFNRPDYDPDDSGEFKKDLVFVAMPFRDEQMVGVYSAIKEECSKLGLNSIRVDENAGSGIIIKEITELIEKAEFIIIDLTFERPNVYYELGYAHGVGNELNDILLIANKNTTIHFNIEPFRVQFYETIEDLRPKVFQNLEKMIRLTR
jgi:hypothetical protein